MNSTVFHPDSTVSSEEIANPKAASAKAIRAITRIALSFICFSESSMRFTGFAPTGRFSCAIPLNYSKDQQQTEEQKYRSESAKPCQRAFSARLEISDIVEFFKYSSADKTEEREEE